MSNFLAGGLSRHLDTKFMLQAKYEMHISGLDLYHLRIIKVEVGMGSLSVVRYLVFHLGTPLWRFWSTGGGDSFSGAQVGLRLHFQDVFSNRSLYFLFFVIFL